MLTGSRRYSKLPSITWQNNRKSFFFHIECARDLPSGPGKSSKIHPWHRHLVSGCVRFCQPRLKFLGERSDYVSAVKEFLKSNADFTNCVICPLGDAKDSGQIVAYLVADTGISPISLKDALEKCQPILFVDDFVGSGGQSKRILSDWFGESDDSNLNEGRRLTLIPEQQEKLRSVPLAFVFAAGWKTGADDFASACSTHGLKAKTYVHHADDVMPTIFNQGLEQMDGFQAFLERSKHVGRALLGAKHATWPPEKLDDRLLGYGNKGLLITFPFNTPSQSLTALWEDGLCDGLPWTPLLPRRPKS